MLVVGLCGGIGAGKSTVAKLLSLKGAIVIDVDEIGRAVLDIPAVRKKVINKFGTQVLKTNGNIDRSALAKKVFTEKTSLNDLEAISHPFINQELANKLRIIAKESPKSVVILDMAVLVESTLGQLPNGLGYSKIVVVEANLKLRLSRLARRGINNVDAKKRISQQASNEERRAIANHLLTNNGDLRTLSIQVDNLWKKLNGEKLKT